MRDFSISLGAQGDIDTILDVSEDRWGVAARDRYEQLIEQAFLQIARDPLGLLSRARREIRRGVRSLHLTAVSTGRVVREPVHVIFYRVTDSEIEVVRILHERMHVASLLRRR